MLRACATLTAILASRAFPPAPPSAWPGLSDLWLLPERIWRGHPLRLLIRAIATAALSVTVLRLVLGQPAALTAQLKRIETAQNSQILDLEELPADPADTAAAAARARIRARFAELHAEREQIETQIGGLIKSTSPASSARRLRIEAIFIL